MGGFVFATTPQLILDSQHTTHNTQQVLYFSHLNGNSFSSLAAAKRKNFPAAFSGTSFAEAMDAGAMDFTGLPGAFGHGKNVSQVAQVTQVTQALQVKTFIIV